MANKESRYFTDAAYRKAVDSYKAAQEVARDWLRKVEGLDTDIRKALIKVIGLPGNTSRPSGARGEILDMLEKGPVTDLELFKKFKYGQAEMKSIIRHMIKYVDLADRVWIAYDEAEEQYYIFGKGEETPEGWTGYLPKDE